MSAETDEFRTIRGPSGAETKVLGSRFIAGAYPIADEEAAESRLRSLREEYHDATHHCHAYRLGIDGKRFRTSDDGEPAGTAGRPILAAIEKAMLTDVLVVVTRYFGGTKLGVGGLMRAYGGAADAALAAATLVTKYITRSVDITFPHSLVGVIMHAIETAGGAVCDTRYDDLVHLRVEIRTSRVDEFCGILRERTGGKAGIDAPG